MKNPRILPGQTASENRVARNVDFADKGFELVAKKSHARRSNYDLRALHHRRVGGRRSRAAGGPVRGRRGLIKIGSPF